MKTRSNAKTLCFLLVLMLAVTASGLSAQAAGSGRMMDMMQMGSNQSMPMDSMPGMTIQVPADAAQLQAQLASIGTLIGQLLSTASARGAGLSESQTVLLSRLLENQSALLRLLANPMPMNGSSMQSGSMSGGMGMMGKM